MAVGTEGLAVTSSGDKRVTRVGRVLRRYKIDELPALWNVVRGEMSLVGPRPEDQRFVDWTDPLHRKVFTAKPGITGLAQLEFSAEEALLVAGDPERVYREEVLPTKASLTVTTSTIRPRGWICRSSGGRSPRCFIHDGDDNASRYEGG